MGRRLFVTGITGDHSKQDQMLFGKIAKYTWYRFLSVAEVLFNRVPRDRSIFDLSVPFG